MKLLRLGAPGEERPSVLADDGRVHDLSARVTHGDTLQLRGELKPDASGLTSNI